MSAAWQVLLFLLCLVIVAIHSDGKQTLLLSTLSRGNSTPEIVSVTFSDGNGDRVTMDSVGYGCQAYYEGFATKRSRKNLAMEIKSMSYDEAKKKLIVQTSTRDESRFSLLLGDPCRSAGQTERGRERGELGEPECQTLREDGGSLDEVLEDFKRRRHDSRSLRTLYREAKTPDSSRVGPFAILDGRIFFVLQRLQTSDFKSKTNVVQIRELNSRCFDSDLTYPILATDATFDLLECSTPVAELVRESFILFHRFRPLDVLLIATTKRGVDFFLQVLEIYSDPRNSSTSGDVRTTVHLFRVPLNTESFEILHAVEMDFNYVKYFLLQLGGMSYKNDFLCWAPLDRIICGLWTGNKISRLRTHLQPTEARRVCSASPNDAGLENIITGLSISSASIGGEIAIHFGCVAQVPRMGGFGFLRSPEGGGPPLQLTRINFKDVPILAGSLVRTERCADSHSSSASILSAILLSISQQWTFACAPLVYLIVQ